MTWQAIDWGDDDLSAALADRDIPRLFQSLRARGISQRAMAARAEIRESEVSEIIRGRHVRTYDVLLRIANGLGVPRGQMGLAYDSSGTSPYEGEEVDEDVERRKFLGVASAALLGNALLGEVGALATTSAQEPVRRVGMSDVFRVEQLTGHLRVMERKLGGDVVRDVVVGHAMDADRLARAEVADDVRVRLNHAIAHAHHLAGWACGDAGRMDSCRWHFARALSYVKGDGERTAEVLAAAASMEKHDDNLDQALKLLQLAFLAAANSRDPQIAAVLTASSVSAYHQLGHRDRARVLVADARARFADATPEKSLPFFEFYGAGHGILAAAQLRIGDFATANTDVAKAIAARPDYDVRCTALDTVVHARLLLNAGEVARGIRTSRRAVELVTEIGSSRVIDRLAPLHKALVSRRDSTCADLARHIETVRRTETIRD